MTQSASDIELKIRNIYHLGPQEIDNDLIQTEIDVRAWFKKSYKEDLFELNTIDHDIENWILLNRQTFIPGKIYIFQYLRKDATSFDSYPIILSLGSKISQNTRNIIEIGLNLNKIPLQYRVSIMSKILKTFERQIDVNLSKISRSEHDQIELPIRFPDQSGIFFDELLQIDPSSAIEFFDRSKIAQLTIRVIKYEDWKYLVHYVTDTFINSSAPIEWQKWIEKQKNYAKK